MTAAKEPWDTFRVYTDELEDEFAPGWEVTYSIPAGGYYMEFKAYAVNNDPIEWPHPDVEGMIKWDGCCNYSMGRHCLIHGCGLEDTLNDHNKLFRALYEKASTMRLWDG